MMNRNGLGLVQIPLSTSGGYPIGVSQGASPFDSKISVPIKTVDELNKLIDISTQFLVDFYSENLFKKETIGSVYLRSLRYNEERLNEAHAQALGDKLKVFKLSKSALRKEEPKEYGSLKAKLTYETERELLNKELVTQCGKTYFGEITLKTENKSTEATVKPKREFTKDRWLIVLLNQCLSLDTDREFYHKQVIESALDPLQVIRVVLCQTVNTFDPCEVFARRSVEYLERVKTTIFKQNFFNYECGKIEEISKNLLLLNPEEKEIVLANACIQCCKNLKKLQVEVVQKMYLLAKGGKQPDEFNPNNVSPRVEERKQSLKSIEMTCSQAVGVALKTNQVYVPTSKLSVVDLEVLKQTAEKSLVEIDLFVRCMTDFITLLKIYQEAKPTNGYKDVFSCSLKIFTMYNQQKK